MSGSGSIDSKLWEAAGAGDEAQVSQLIEQGAEVDWREDDNYWTALHKAASEGHTPVVNRLVDAGWNLEATEKYGSTPLTVAAWQGQLEAAKCLLLRGAKIDTQDDQKWTTLHTATRGGQRRMVHLLLHCGANPKIRNSADKTAEEEEEDEAIAAEFRNFRIKFNTRYELFQCAVEEKSYDIAAILAHSSQEAYIVNQIIEILVNDKIKDLTFLVYFQRCMSQNHPIAKNLLQHFNKNAMSFNGNNPLHHGASIGNLNILKFSLEHAVNIEERNLDGNTPLHIAAASDNKEIVNFLIENGASSTQFVKNKAGRIPLEIARHDDNLIFRIILLDFLDFALKSPRFSSNEFQRQLGSGINLFCLTREFQGKKTLLEYINEQGMIKEREELIQLLIKIDHFRYKDRSKSKRRIIKILRAGIRSSKGLKDSIESVQANYSWENGKIAFKCFWSVFYNILFGWSLYASDVVSDVYFYQSLGQSGNNTTTNNTIAVTRIVTLVHIILPFLCSCLLFFTMLYSKLVKGNWYLPMKFPLPPVTKLFKTVIECRFFINNKNMEDENYEKRKSDLIQELEDQKTITTISMINEASMESSFQYFLQGLFSLPTLVYYFMNIYDGKLNFKELVNWKIVSIILSFLSFALTSINIR